MQRLFCYNPGHCQSLGAQDYDQRTRLTLSRRNALSLGDYSRTSLCDTGTITEAMVLPQVGIAILVGISMEQYDQPLGALRVLTRSHPCLGLSSNIQRTDKHMNSREHVRQIRNKKSSRAMWGKKSAAPFRENFTYMDVILCIFHLSFVMEQLY